MIRHIRIWTLIALVALGTACAPSEETVEPEVATPEVAPKPLPPVSVLIGHRVADFDTWKTVFDEHMPTRKEAGCLGHYLKRGESLRPLP